MSRRYKNLPPHIRERYLGIVDSEEQAALNMVRRARREHRKGTTRPIEEMCRRVELREKHPGKIPMPIGLVPPPQSRT